jgi:hypothetical protein
MKARIKAYSTRVWPFLLFIRRSATLALVIILLIIVFSPPLNKKNVRKWSKVTPAVRFGQAVMVLSLSIIISRANRKMRTKTFFRKIVNLYINCLKHAYYKTIKKCKRAEIIKNWPVE